MYCSKCGAEINENAKFCPSCGNSIGETINNYNQSQPIMSPTATSVVAYMTWVGFLIAICAGDRVNSKFFLNQALVFNIFCMLCIIPIIGWLWAIFMLVCFILGVVWAGEQSQKQLPLIGMIKILQ